MDGSKGLVHRFEVPWSDLSSVGLFQHLKSPVLTSVSQHIDSRHASRLLISAAATDGGSNIDTAGDQLDSSGEVCIRSSSCIIESALLTKISNFST